MTNRALLPLLSTTAIMYSANVCADTELHIQQAALVQPFGDQAGSKADTLIFTLQHSSNWAYGSNFFFVDTIRTRYNTDFYAEWYPSLSGAKAFDWQFSGWIKDLRLVAGINAGADSNVMKYLPGVQISWDMPGFTFFNTMLTGYLDDNQGLASGGAPREGDSWMLDIAWRYPLSTSSQKFSIEGHAEFIQGRNTELANVRKKDWVLAQIQLRWDLGHALWNTPNQLFVGTEYQIWRNKLGTSLNEDVAQILVVWRF